MWSLRRNSVGFLSTGRFVEFVEFVETFTNIDIIVNAKVFVKMAANELFYDPFSMWIQSVLLKIYWWCFREFNKCYPIINLRILVNNSPTTSKICGFARKIVKNDDK